MNSFIKVQRKDDLLYKKSSKSMEYGISHQYQNQLDHVENHSEDR